MSVGQVFIGMTLLAVATAAAAQGAPLANAPAPRIFQDVVQCRAIADAGERLACYDRSVAALETAQKTKDLYVADREAVAEARRGLFGFSLPNMRIFNDDDMAEDVSSIETTIKAVSEGQRGYTFTLADGARWVQTEKKYMDRPKVGAKIRIRRAVMGSYMASINGKPGFRIERVNN